MLTVADMEVSVCGQNARMVKSSLTSRAAISLSVMKSPWNVRAVENLGQLPHRCCRVEEEHEPGAR